MLRIAHFFTIFLTVASLWLVGAIGVFAQDSDDFQRGMVIYQQKNYDAAIPLFTNAAQKGNVRATYYLALCHQQLKQDAKAIELFRHISKNFKGSAEAVMCDSYLQRVPQQAEAPAKSAVQMTMDAVKQKVDEISEAKWKTLPQTARIPFQMKNGHMYVQAKVNGQYMDIIFDTGASMCGISVVDYPNLFSSAEVAKAPSIPVSRPHGLVTMKLVNGEVSVDRVTRNCKIMLTTEKGISVIGQNFFKEYTYEIDGFYIRMTKAPYVSPIVVVEGGDGAGTRNLAKTNVVNKGSDKVAVKNFQKVEAPAVAKKQTDKYTVPFVSSGNCMIVQVLVNGKPTPATFDTGCAPDGLVMPMGFVRVLGIQSNSDGYYAERAEIGPIVRKYAPVNFANGLDCILIGPKFFGDRPYRVDPVNNVIKFQY